VKILHCDARGSWTHDETNILDADSSQVVLKDERIYRHNLFHINYTTYDVSRAQETVNPHTDHCDVMLLSRQPSAHPFCYARVLGIYHTNAIYIGPGLRDYQSRRIEFLWVQWFEVLNRSAGWDHTTLDSVKFPPMAEADAFDFIDPADVLRCCHIIPPLLMDKCTRTGSQCLAMLEMRLIGSGTMLTGASGSSGPFCGFSDFSYVQIR